MNYVTEQHSHYIPIAVVLFIIDTWNDKIVSSQVKLFVTIVMFLPWLGLFTTSMNKQTQKLCQIAAQTVIQTILAKESSDKFPGTSLQLLWHASYKEH